MKNFLKTIPLFFIALVVGNNVIAQEYADPTKVLENGKAPGLKVKVLSKTNSTTTYMLIFAKGDEVVAGLTEFARRYTIKSGSFSGIGDALSAKAGWFDYKRKKFKIIPIDTAEVTSFSGDI